MNNKKNLSSNAGSNGSTTPNKEFINPFEGISCMDWTNRQIIQMVDDAWQRTIDAHTDTDLFDVYKRPKDPEEDFVRAYLAGLDEWRDEQAAYAEEAMQQDAFEERFNDPVVVYFYEEVLDELRSLEEARDHLIEEFNRHEEMYKERASGIEFDCWLLATLEI